MRGGPNRASAIKQFFSFSPSGKGAPRIPDSIESSCPCHPEAGGDQRGESNFLVHCQLPGNPRKPDAVQNKSVAMASRLSRNFSGKRLLPSARSVLPTRLCREHGRVRHSHLVRRLASEQPSTATRQKACQVCGSTRAFTECWICSAWESRSKRRESGSSSSASSRTSMASSIRQTGDRPEFRLAVFSGVAADPPPGNGRTAGASRETSCPGHTGTFASDPPARSRFAGKGLRGCRHPGDTHRTRHGSRDRRS